MTEMGPAEGSEGQTQLKFLVPTRGMIGIRSALLTATKVRGQIIEVYIYICRDRVGKESHVIGLEFYAMLLIHFLSQL